MNVPSPAANTLSFAQSCSTAESVVETSPELSDIKSDVSCAETQETISNTINVKNINDIDFISRLDMF